MPTSPDCQVCPLADSCVALRDKRVEELPRKSHKVKTVNRYFSYIYVRAGVYTFINKRGAGDIWQNLYEFPLIETPEKPDESELFALPEWNKLLGGQAVKRIRLVESGVKHVLSHRVVYASCYEVVLENEDAFLDGFQRIREEDLHKFPVSRLISHFFSLLLEPKIR